MSFPKSQFLKKGFSDFFRIDQNVHDGGILLFVREDIPTKGLSTESIPSEYYLSKPKWLISCSYNLHKNTIFKHTEILSKNLDYLQSPQYEKNIIMRFQMSK